MDTKKLRQKILDLAIHGKLVPQDPNDEPASVLLERIRKEKEQLIKEGKIKAPKKGKSAGDTSHYPKEVPWELPEGWEWSTLGEVCSKVVDGDHNPPPSEPTPTEYLMISSKNVLDGHLDELKEVRYLSRSVFEECNKRTRLMRGDLLLTTVGTLGRSCIYDGNKKIVLQRSVSVLTPLVSSEYVKCFLDSGYFQRHIDNNARGTAQKGFYLNLLEATILPIPSLHEQRRIVAKTSSLLSELNRIDNENCVLQDRISQAKSRILDLAIHGKLVPQNPSDEPAIELLKRIKPHFIPSDNLHYEGDFPNGWVLASLGEVSNYGHCISVPVEKIGNDDWVLELEDIEKDTGRILQRLSKKDRKISGIRHQFKKGQILYSKLRTYLNKVLIADEDGFCTTEIIPITPIDGVNALFLIIVLRSQYFLDYTQNCCYGVKMPRLGTNDAKKAFIPLPPFEEQGRIVAAVKGLFLTITQIGHVIENQE